MNRVADVAAMIVSLAMLAVLVAPNSQGPNFISAVTNGFATTIRSASSPAWA